MSEYSFDQIFEWREQPAPSLRGLVRAPHGIYYLEGAPYVSEHYLYKAEIQYLGEMNI